MKSIIYKGREYTKEDVIHISLDAFFKIKEEDSMKKLYVIYTNCDDGSKFKSSHFMRKEFGIHIPMITDIPIDEFER